MLPLNQAPHNVAVKTFVFIWLAAIALSGCGGGGGGSTAPGSSLAAAPAINGADGDLIISEVASNYFSNDVAWLEVYNPGALPVALGAYTLRSSYLDQGSSISVSAPLSFVLPDVAVPSNGYLVIAAKTYDRLQNNAQMVYVKNGARVPFWGANGFVELVKEGASKDFVRFGTSAVEPLTPAAWSGANVAAMPSGANEHGKSIVRLAAGGIADTNSAADWALVNFATPAGLNDVAAGVTDSDQDGIPDSAKAQGGTYAGMDLYAMGARPGRRDIFVEVDYMQGADPALAPRREAMQKLVDAFAAKNIAVHFDTGPLYSPAFDPALFNLDGGNPVNFAACVELATSAAGAADGCTSFYDYKSANFDLRRNLVFHYALFANSLNLDGSAGPSGVAELSGNDLIVSMGGYGFSTGSNSGLNLLINLQAGTLMHELGHNLGLRHGGNENVNYKPNHYSVMNYMYQFAGLSATPDSAYAAERYYLANGLKGKTLCNLVENSPCTSGFIMSYSSGNGMPLDENNLSEAANIGHGSAAGAYADWDGSNSLTSGAIARNINPLDDNGKSLLKDYDEWANLAVSFSRGRSGNNYGVSMTTNTQASPAARTNPMNQHPRHAIREAPLPAVIHATIRELHGGKHRGHK